MRKIVVLSMISLDGVMQGPGGPKEDTSGGFKYGGWTAPFGDEEFGKVSAGSKRAGTCRLSFGQKKTFKIWAGYWPQHGDFWPAINAGTKYVFSKSMKKSNPLVTGWKNTEVIKSVAEIKKLKNSKGKDIQVWGSSQLIQLLLKNDLVDELRLKILPVDFRQGKKNSSKRNDSGSIYINRKYCHIKRSYILPVTSGPEKADRYRGRYNPKCYKVDDRTTHR